MEEEEKKSSLAPGAMVGGRFRVDRLIGRGGMGEVYAARHTTTGREVALKLIIGAAATGKDHVRRFLREARAATAIQHPNVIEVLDVFEDEGGTPVMVMELLKGEPFSAMRERAGALKLYEAASILLAVARGLKVAHDKGIVHRDLKPDNVFLAETANGRTPKLLDFGIAKVLDPTKLGSETQGQNTNTGSILGTPHYMSYEQAMSDKRVDHRTDIWAMGVMMFEALTGVRPLQYETLGQMYTAFLQASVPSIRQAYPAIPADFADVLDRCLVKQPDGRLKDLAPLIEVLAKYCDPTVPGAQEGGRVLATLEGGTTTPAVTSSSLSKSIAEPGRRSRPLVFAAAGAATLAAVGGVWFFAGGGGHGSEGLRVPDGGEIARAPATTNANASDSSSSTAPAESGSSVARTAPPTASQSAVPSVAASSAGKTNTPPTQTRDAGVRGDGLRGVGAVRPTTAASSTTGGAPGVSTGTVPVVKGIPEKAPY